jgi:hypothetical protein
MQYEVTGRLIDRKTRAPLAGVLVNAPEIGDTTETGRDGRFLLRGRTVPQCYRLRVTVPTHLPADISVDLTASPRADIGDELLDSVNPRTRSVHALRCPPPGGGIQWDWTIAYGTIRGRVTTPYGLIRAGQSVRTSCPASDTVRTDRAGYYRLDVRVPFSQRRLGRNKSLTCSVWVEDDTVAVATRTVRMGPTPWAHPPAIASFGSPKLRHLHPIVLTGRLISQYDGAPVADADIRVPDLDVYARSAADGTFTLRFQSPPGCVRLAVGQIGYDAAEGVIRIGGPATRTVGDVSVSPAYSGPVTHPIEGARDDCRLDSPLWPVHAVRFGSVAGRFTGPKGSPIRDRPVGLACGSDIASEAVTDENGIFVADAALNPVMADSVRSARHWNCLLGNRPVRLRLAKDLLKAIPLIVDDAAAQGGRRP